MATELMAAINMLTGHGTSDWNEHLYAAQQRARRGPTPEVFFSKHIDNTRLRKAPDPQRVREIRSFACAMIVLFALVMVYVGQHFSSIEYGYRIEAQKQQLNEMEEANRQLRLSEARLSEPSRLDKSARLMGLSAPSPNQFVHFNPADGAPVEARATVPAPPARASNAGQ